MKNLILTMVLLITSSYIMSQRKDYLPMLGDSIVWHFSGEPWNDTYTLSPEKDTLINGILYKKIAEEMWHGDVIAYIREDTLLQQVHILSKDSTEERLLYDFSLNQGDSTYLEFIHTEYNLRTGWYTVDTIMDYFYNNTYRKLFYLSCPNNPFLPEFDDYPRLYWINGVGSIIHPLYLDHLNWHVGLHPLCPQHIYEMALICTHLNGEHIYKHPCWGLSCDGIDIQENEAELHTGIYPNPVTGISKLDLRQFENKIEAIEIYNLQGCLLKKVKITTEVEYFLHKGNFAPGFYFLKTKLMNNETFTFKFLIN